MEEAYTRDEIKKTILEQTDLAKMIHNMIKDGEVHPDALRNPYAKDENGNCTIQIDLRQDGTIGIICPFHETETDSACKINRDGDKRHPYPYLHCFRGDCALGEGTFDAIDMYMILRYPEIDPVRLIRSKKLKSGYGAKQFFETRRVLAGKLGITYTDEKRKLTEEELKDRKKNKIRTQAAKLYQNAYYTHEKRGAIRNYMMKDRGFEKAPEPFKDLIKKYTLGYAPVEWDKTTNRPVRKWLYNKLKDKYSDQELLDAGVVWRNKETNEIYDFLNGFVIPYWSGGKINNLYARNIYGKKKSEQNKKDNRHLRLPGGVDIPTNFDAAKNYEDVILVEGEISWLSLVALGYENTMANRGTNGLSDTHIEMFLEEREASKGKNCKRFYICFDQDENQAGQEATLRDGERLQNEGFEVYVMQIPQGDPNDFLKKGGTKEEFEILKTEAMSFDAYKIINIIGKRSYTTNAQRVAALRGARPYIQKLYSDERILIAAEVSELLNMPREELEKAWSDYEKVPGLKQALDSGRSWIWVMDDLKVFEILSSKFKNTIYVQDQTEVLKELKESEQFKYVILNSEMKKERKTFFLHNLEQKQLAEIPTDDPDKLKQVSKKEIMNFVRDVS